jgi:hypothetical protein
MPNKECSERINIAAGLLTSSAIPHDKAVLCLCDMADHVLDQFDADDRNIISTHYAAVESIRDWVHNPGDENGQVMKDAYESLSPEPRSEYAIALWRVSCAFCYIYRYAVDSGHYAEFLDYAVKNLLAAVEMLHVHDPQNCKLVAEERRWQYEHVQQILKTNEQVSHS